MAVLLNLFSDSVWQALTQVDASSGLSVSSLRSDAYAPSAVSNVVRGIRRDSVVCRWCAGCPLDGLCDSDQCGARPQSLYDFNERVARHVPDGCWSGRFPNLGVFISFKKQHGWL